MRDPLSASGIRCRMTTGDRSARLAPGFLSWTGDEERGSGRDSRSVIEVDAAQSFQSIDGFGFALTGGSAQLIGGLPGPVRARLLRELFSRESGGIGVSALRLGIGASDLSAESYSYDDLPQGMTDPDLARFSLDAGDREIVPLLREILAVNPALRIIASPWSAPPWMKTNGGFIGGRLRPECYGIYARYLVRFVQAMKANGIPVHGLTPQNEPRNGKNEPSMEMAPAEETAFIRDHLGPALRGAGLGRVELFCWDHNCDEISYPLSVLADGGAREYLSGVAWHLYAGDIAALGRVHEAYPGMKMYFTEQWVGSDGNFADDLRWHVRNVLIGAMRNWSRAVLEWNLASDPQCGPHTRGGEDRCVGALTIFEGAGSAGAGGDRIIRNVAYYVVAHAAGFVPPHARRIASRLVDGLPNVAFRTREGTVVLIILNDGSGPREFEIAFGKKRARAILPGGAVATLVWPME